ncbi:MAG: T9SS type A sorting domain-containing protein [bacterium]
MTRHDHRVAIGTRALGAPSVLLLSLLFCALSLGMAAAAHAATIRSTIAGGPWTSGSTWVGGIAPSASDNVILDGPVTVQANTNCVGLEVAATGLLRKNTAAPVTFAAAGSITNAGTIEDGSGVLKLRVGGDITNDGVWTNVETILTGAAAHRLSQSASAVFEGDLTRDLAASGALFLDTPFAILGNFDQDLRSVVIAPQCPLTLRGGTLQGAVLAQGNEIRFEGWSYINGGTFDSAVLVGTAVVTSGTFTGGLTVVNSLSNSGSFGNAHIFIEGGLVNFGIIQNDDYGFTMDLAGDLECYGTMRNSFVQLDDTAPHAIRMGPSGDINTTLLLPEFGAGTIVVETDALISDAIALGNGGTMILEPGVTLTLSGGSITGGTLLAQGNEILMSGTGYLRLAEIDDVVLNGTTQFAGSTSVTGDVRVDGTLQNWAFLASEIDIEGDLVNAGVIRNNTQTLTLRIGGDALNGGVWENKRVVLDGAEDQLVEIGAGIAVPEFVLAAGFASSSYQWTRDGAPIAGETAAEMEFVSVAAADAGVYRCEGGEGQISRAIVLGVGVVTGTPTPTPNAATTLTLAPIWPNPVRAAQSAAAATIEFALPAAGNVSVDVFDASGRAVTRLPSRWFAAGSHRRTWAVSGAAPGVYFVRLESAGAVATRKLIVIE